MRCALLTLLHGLSQETPELVASALSAQSSHAPNELLTQTSLIALSEEVKPEPSENELERLTSGSTEATPGADRGDYR